MKKILFPFSVVILIHLVACKKTGLTTPDLPSDGLARVNDIAPIPPPGNYWQIRASFAGVRSGACSFVINGKGYVFGGYQGGSFKKDLWQYDPVANTWTPKASLPFHTKARTNAVALVIGTKAYVGTGDSPYDPQSGYQLKDWWEYDPALNQWTKKKDLEGEARGRAVAFAVNGKGYIATGSNEFINLFMNDVWEYDPLTDDWTQKANWTSPGVQTGRYDAVAFAINGKAYVGTGFGSGTPNHRKDFWEYNPAADLWTKKADFAGGIRANAVGFASPTVGFIGTGAFTEQGTGDEYFMKDFWSYNPTSNAWTKKADFPGYNRSSGTGFFLNNRGYLGFGYHPVYNSTNDFYRYVP